jgi:hypothetical protein
MFQKLRHINMSMLYSEDGDFPFSVLPPGMKKRPFILDFFTHYNGLELPVSFSMTTAPVMENGMIVRFGEYLSIQFVDRKVVKKTHRSAVKVIDPLNKFYTPIRRIESGQKTGYRDCFPDILSKKDRGPAPVSLSGDLLLMPVLDNIFDDPLLQLPDYPYIREALSEIQVIEEKSLNVFKSVIPRGAGFRGFLPGKRHPALFANSHDHSISMIVNFFRNLSRQSLSLTGSKLFPFFVDWQLVDAPGHGFIFSAVYRMMYYCAMEKKVPLPIKIYLSDCNRDHDPLDSLRIIFSVAIENFCAFPLIAFPYHERLASEDLMGQYCQLPIYIGDTDQTAACFRVCFRLPLYKKDFW